MIKANELRIGNYVQCDLLDDSYIDRKPYYGKCVYYVSVIFPLSCKIETGHGSVQQLSEIDINPIPLTEEWLLRFGFEQCDLIPNSYSKEFNNTEIIICKFCDRDSFYFSFPLTNNYVCECDDMKEIDFVHQLQNLYFALTGEELTLKN